MIPEKENIEQELIEFVHSNQFDNFRKIMNSFAYNQFKIMQDVDKKPTPDEMLSQRELLNFYMKTPVYLENKVAGIERRLLAEKQEKINKAQEEL